MNKSMEIKNEIFVEVLRSAKELTELSLEIFEANEELESDLQKNEEKNKKEIINIISENESQVYFFLESILQKIHTLDELQEIIMKEHEREIEILKFEHKYKKVSE